MLGREKFQELAQKAIVAAIGPVTSDTLREYGITPRIQPKDYTIPALAAAIIEFITPAKKE